MSQNLAEVRAAAERMVNCYYSSTVHDDIKVAKYVLETIPADAESPVTADWLREEWGWDSHGTASMHYDRDEFTALCWSDDGLSFVAKTYKMRCYTKGFPITTRHQFRQLAGILGIQPKK